MIDLKPTNRATTMKIRGDFVLLRADGLRLLLPQREVMSTEYRDHAPAATAQAGVFALEDAHGTPHPVAALSDRMELMDRFPQDRFLLTRFAGAGLPTALAWNDVRVLIDTELELHALPAVMQDGAGLVDAYVEIDHELAFCTTAQRMFPEALAQPD